jgi:hypothetical protein
MMKRALILMLMAGAAQAGELKPLDDRNCRRSAAATASALPRTWC